MGDLQICRLDYVCSDWFSFEEQNDVTRSQTHFLLFLGQHVVSAHELLKPVDGSLYAL